MEYPLLYEELKKAGFIINESFDELDYIKLQNKRIIYTEKDYHITINPTLDCNLTCWYCSTEYNEAKHNGGMTLEMVENLKAHIKNILLEEKATSLHLDWFGGEPMMYFDEVIDPIAEYSYKLTKENKVKFTQHITTNATLIDESKIQRMKELNFTSFQIPIDGNEKRHNKIKFFNNKVIHIEKSSII
ncbi:MAG: radical SAM protein [Tannerellaceae bacterium]|nr:radical SAM protein [Tannerellaceae bacterium]